MHFFSVYCGCNQYQLNSHVINRTLLKFCCAQQNQFGSVIQFPSSISARAPWKWLFNLGSKFV
uniref:Uncharacterized protein n=1 Tax=Anguilla anguilla TaxID=7936 RepID=A0A0E9RJR3_ANGAN